jgi:tRNA dimethylallyltransferase
MAAPRVVALVGATATGKTDLGEALARAIGGEVVCADSRQVFRELDVGTGKPPAAVRAASPHHLFEALTLGDRASAGWYASAAATKCAELQRRGRTPVLVGGSGLYLRAARSGLSAEPPHHPEARARLQRELATAGVESLHRRLAEVDPITAARVAPRDAQRITRALEVFEASGRPLAWWHERTRGPALEGAWQMIELSGPMAWLDARIAARTCAMFEEGLVEEARGLREQGSEGALRALRAVGYDEALDLLAGGIGREEAEARTRLRTRQLAKRQRTWFRHQIEAVRIDAEGRDPATLLELALEALA